MTINKKLLDAFLKLDTEEEIARFFSSNHDVEEHITYFHVCSYIYNIKPDCISPDLINEIVQNRNKRYVVIGSSPVALLKANFWASLGMEVEVIEGSSIIGGPWSVVNTLGMDDMPRATHIIMPNIDSYEFLKNVFNVKLEKSEPAPYELDCKNKSLIPFPSNQFVFNKYPGYNGAPHQIIGGAKELVKKLLVFSRLNNVKIIKNFKVSKISKENQEKGLFGVYSENNTSKFCDKIALTTGVNLKSIIDDEHHIFTNDLYENISLHILVTNGHANYKFIHLVNHNFIKEFQDITETISNKEQKLYVIKLKYNFWKEYTNALTIEKVLDELKNLEIITGENNVVDHCQSEYMNYRMSDNLVNYLTSKYANDICLLPFAPGSNDGEHKWASQDLSIVMGTEKFYDALLWT